MRVDAPTAFDTSTATSLVQSTRGMTTCSGLGAIVTGDAGAAVVAGAACLPPPPPPHAVATTPTHTDRTKTRRATALAARGVLRPLDRRVVLTPGVRLAR